MSAHRSGGVSLTKHIGLWFRDVLIRRKSMNATRIVAGGFAIIILLGTLLLMLPVGYLLPQLLPLTAVRAVLLGAGVSLCIELIQLITRLGMFELDDLIYNTLGVALGYGLLVCMEKRTGERLRR